MKIYSVRHTHMMEGHLGFEVVEQLEARLGEELVDSCDIVFHSFCHGPVVLAAA